MSVHVVIDTKNLALYAGGIAAYVRPLVVAWLAHRPDVRFSLVGPAFQFEALQAFRNWTHVAVPWPTFLPRPTRHPLYDNLLFPRALRRLAPDFVFSPYHDVRLPKPGKGPASVMMIHDTCLDQLKGIYPAHHRVYYLAMLRLNLRRAAHVITISEASRQAILARYPIPPERLSVVYNTAESDFANGLSDSAELATLRRAYGDGRLLFYPGGSEYRKNVARLVDALVLLIRSGQDMRLLVTGVLDARWVRALAGKESIVRDRVRFLGRLDGAAVKAHYAAADVVVYPTLCEGFGRVCLEAMHMGTPLACSDLPVLREVANDYACYFDPTDPRAIAEAIRGAIASGRQIPRQDARFSLGVVTKQFTELMDRLLSEAT